MRKNRISFDCHSELTAEPKGPPQLNVGGYAISAAKVTPGKLLNRLVTRNYEHAPKSQFLLDLEAKQANASKSAAIVRQMNHYRKNR